MIDLADPRIKRVDGRPNYDLIRAMYAEMMPAINEAGDRWCDPYFLDWPAIFTPIESQMWALIRSQHVPFYPQFPVGRFFVDFGNPRKRLAIECDGALWHDAKRDRKRDQELFDAGWTVVRFSGAACYQMDRLAPQVFNAPPFTCTDAYWMENEPEETQDDPRC